MKRRHPISTLFPYPTLSRSGPLKRSEPRPRKAVALFLRLPPPTPSPSDRRPASLSPSGRRQEGGRSNFNHVHSKIRPRSEEHTSELQSRQYLVCRLLLEKKK